MKEVYDAGLAALCELRLREINEVDAGEGVTAIFRRI
jgi:hypothetical protein